MASFARGYWPKPRRATLSDGAAARPEVVNGRDRSFLAPASFGDRERILAKKQSRASGKCSWANSGPDGTRTTLSIHGLCRLPVVSACRFYAAIWGRSRQLRLIPNARSGTSDGAPPARPGKLHSGGVRQGEDGCEAGKSPRARPWFPCCSFPIAVRSLDCKDLLAAAIAGAATRATAIGTEALRESG